MKCICCDKEAVYFLPSVDDGEHKAGEEIGVCEDCDNDFVACDRCGNYGIYGEDIHLYRNSPDPKKQYFCDICSDEL